MNFKNLNEFKTAMKDKTIDEQQAAYFRWKACDADEIGLTDHAEQLREEAVLVEARAMGYEV